MSEITKTVSLIVVAAALLVVAFATKPSVPTADPDDAVGKALFPELNDPLKVKRMRIVSFDESLSRPKEFEVAQINGVWSLPSHKNYPADAKDQMAAAASALVDVKPLGVVTDNAREHELYGVVEPKPSEDQFGHTGVGKLVVLEDEAKKPLARLIIGKQDKASKPDDMTGNPIELRFVRVPGQDRVYRVALKTNKLTTKFADWIETDLLKMNPWDIADIKLHDYSVTEGITPAGEPARVLNKRADIDLAFDDKTSKWTLKELLEYKGKDSQEVKLAEDEELNEMKLNELKNALGSLKIMDVARKPEKMSANLKADKDFTNEVDAVRDLMKKGFLPRILPDGQVEIVSSDGEVVVQMKDGVEYLLRFGSVAGIDTGSEDDKKAEGDEKSTDDKKDEAEKKDAGGLSRYIMVMAQFNENLLPKPELEPLPEEKKTPKPDDSKANATSEDAKSDGKKSDAKSDAKGAAKSDAKGAAKSDTKAADVKSAKADDKKGTAKSDVKAEAKPEESKPTEAKAEPATEDDQDAIDREHDRIEKENRRKQETYDDKVKAGQAKAKELNSRFADWYYVVGDETYRKIHLNKSDIIKKKQAADATTGAAKPPVADPFRQLQGIPGLGK